jgi:hypothetical protein
MPAPRVYKINSEMDVGFPVIQGEFPVFSRKCVFFWTTLHLIDSFELTRPTVDPFRSIHERV